MGGRALQAAAGLGAQRLVHVRGEHGVPRAAHAHGAVVCGDRPHRRRVHRVARLLKDLSWQVAGSALDRSAHALLQRRQVGRSALAAGRGRCCRGGCKA
jgi:hypothetical protein